MKNKLRQELRKRIKTLAAIDERKKIQSFDARFKLKHRDQFRKPTIKTRQGVKLRVNGETTSDHDIVMHTWVDHFKDIGKSRADEKAPVASANNEMQGMVTESFVNVETVLDVPFTAEEIEAAIKHLKVGKAGGDDDIQPEHIKFGGHQLTVWLMHICNSIVELEGIPSTMKMGVLCPLYKGGGKDPLETGSYRGIALTSVWAKLLEILILHRLLPIMEDLDLPHINQTGYRKGNSCADAIFATLEVISQFVSDGDKVYMCLYDLHKAYDSVEYSILLKRLYEAGINSKCWRLIKAWYHQPMCKVKVDGRTSSSFVIERGVRQGSVLSPALFLIVMNPLLQRMQQRRLGATVHGLYAGAFAHADDIRTVTSSKESMEQQINLTLSFTQESGLTLNPQKCEVIVMSKTKHPKEVVCCIDQQQLIPKDAAKCLGFWWSWNLAAKTAVDEAVKKARRAFFLFGGMGAFQGDLNPLSGRAFFETCVVPTLLYGCENWILTEDMLLTLESFQEEIGRRILKLSGFHSGLAVRVLLQWPSVKARVLMRKLIFLKRVVSGDDVVSSQVFRTLVAGDVNRIQLVQECRYLEENLATSFTSGILQQDSEVDSRELKKTIIAKDWNQTLHQALSHQSSKMVAKVAEVTSWMKIWDVTLDKGPRGTKSMLALLFEITKPAFGSKPCPYCDIEELDSSLFHHLMETHPYDHVLVQEDPAKISQLLVDIDSDSDIFYIAERFLRRTVHI